MNSTPQIPRRFIVLGIVFLVAICLVFIVPLFFVTTIDAGEVGVVDTFGNVSDKPLYPGIQLKNPFATVVKFPTRVTEYTMAQATNEGNKQGDDSIEALTKDGANINLDVTVLFRVKAEEAPKIYRELGVNYEESLVRPEIRSVIRNVFATYSVTEAYSDKRGEITQKIKDNLQASLDKRGLQLEDVLLRDLRLSDTLSKSIEEKLAAQQEAAKQEFVLDKEQKEAERKVIEAKGQRDAQAIINESLSSKYLYYLYITSLKDRAGTIYVPTENGMPIFKNVDDK